MHEKLWMCVFLVSDKGKQAVLCLVMWMCGCMAVLPREQQQPKLMLAGRTDAACVPFRTFGCAVCGPQLQMEVLFSGNCKTVVKSGLVKHATSYRWKFCFQATVKH